MQIPVKRLTDLDMGDRERILRRAQGDLAEVLPVVEQVMDNVARDGDVALRSYTERFDGAVLTDLRVTEAEFAAARAGADPTLLEALAHAARNITAFHSTQVLPETAVTPQEGVRLWRVWRAIERVGLYVPGGKAAYPSSVLMNVIPARIAGCREIVICTPPNRAGAVSPAVLVAADLLGVHQVFKLGGSQAIAALAYGTASVPRVQKLFGAGNRWVTLAKQVAASRGLAAIDLPAGPTELLLIADETAPAAFLAADMIAQAEHAEDSASVLLTTSAAVAEAVCDALVRQLEGLPTRAMVQQSLARYGLIALVDSLEQAVAFSNEYAPEHLGIMTADPQAVLAGIVNAGSVFLGPWSAQPAGDYAAGTNHVLPTGGAGAMYGPLSVESFGRKLQVQELSASGLAGLRSTVGTLATSEGLPGHRAAIEARFV
ncbi:MAG TPA: histidinol dehydrogenase [Chloroflexia bacterium]|nr:histidinol dehydrogenase [Chloroflexia bacterium]